MKKLFPTLYKKTSTGSIQEWTIYVNQCEIHTTFGRVDGKLQTTTDVIESGKNIGRSNETGAGEQAVIEAQAKWEKQKKKGYVDSEKAAETDMLDDLIEGGVLPMLAHTFEKQGKKIVYPCYVQPKLDGLRMIAILKDGVCTLWSRTRKPITSLPHIIAEIENRFSSDIILDGEAYNHAFKSNFEHIVHLVKQEEPDDECFDVQYHIYDVVNKDPFEKRIKMLAEVFSADGPPTQYLKLVDTAVLNLESEVADYYTKYKDLGYEGAMLRNAASLYVNKRSSDLIKVKEMQDDEFPIIGVEEGRGRLAGHVGAFVCRTKDGQEFKAKMCGETSRLKEFFETPRLWKGKQLTVQFQDLTSYGIPRFPVGLRIRAAE